MLPTVRGLPWWGAVLVATVITGIGAAIDANTSDGLGAVFKFCYLLGCVVAALAVRRRALFTAAAQPPLIAFLVGVITLYGLNSDAASSGLKSLIFKVLLPIANSFPWMALTFLVTLGLVLARWYLTRDRTAPEPKRPSTTDAKAATPAARKAGPQAAAPRGTGKRPADATRSTTRTNGAKAATTKAPAKTDTAQVPERPRKRKPPAAGQRPARPPQADAVDTGVAVDTPPVTTPKPAKKRATAGAVLRAEAGEQIQAIDVAPPPPPRRRPTADRPEYQSAARPGAVNGYNSTRARSRG